jgi:hypothetical protein
LLGHGHIQRFLAIGGRQHAKPSAVEMRSNQTLDQRIIVGNQTRWRSSLT